MFVIREAGESDLDLLVAFSVALARRTEGLRLDRSLVEKGRRSLIDNGELGFILVAESPEAGLVGEVTIGGKEWSEWSHGQFWIVTSFCIRPGWHGRGVDVALRDELEARARQASVLGIRGNIRSTNEYAQKWLFGLGFRDNCYRVFEQRFDQDA
jgi:ribosomal protein S18 acetylase RimI-like enzyme